jgi:hypothetical protein
MADNYSLGDLGLGGLGDMLKQQVADDETERKKKLLQAGANKPPAQANALGLGAINLIGGLSGGARG